MFTDVVIKIKYEIETIDNDQDSLAATLQTLSQKPRKIWYIVTPVLLLIAITAFLFIKPQEKQDFLVKQIKNHSIKC